jgi:hypothetical protein
MFWAAALIGAVGPNRRAPRRVLASGVPHKFSAFLWVCRKHTSNRSDDAVVAARSWAVAADVRVFAGHRRHDRWALVRVGWAVVWHARDSGC